MKPDIDQDREGQYGALLSHEAIPTSCAFHGGKSFEAIGADFRTLERSSQVVPADVLDAWFDPPPNVLRRLQEFLPFLVRSSPPVHGKGLIEAIARARSIPEESVLLGGGSSDLIFSCLPRLFDVRQRAMILDPMYGEYRYFFEEVLETELLRFPLHEKADFKIDTEAFIDQVRVTEPGMVIVVNPNSPTGQLWPRSELMRFIDALSEKTRVLIDETYIEYAGRAESVEGEAHKRDNLLVLKSMSKVYALSGMRVGYLVGSPDLIRKLARWMPPWAVSLPAQVAAVGALADPKYYGDRYLETHALREGLAAGLRKAGDVRVYPSCTNFLLVRVPKSAQRTLLRMYASNVYVRNCDSMGTGFNDHFLRVAVRVSQENERIKRALAESI